MCVHFSCFEGCGSRCDSNLTTICASSVDSKSGPISKAPRYRQDFWWKDQYFYLLKKPEKKKKKNCPVWCCNLNMKLNVGIPMNMWYIYVEMIERQNEDSSFSWVGQLVTLCVEKVNLIHLPSRFGQMDTSLFQV